MLPDSSNFTLNESNEHSFVDLLLEDAGIGFEDDPAASSPAQKKSSLGTSNPSKSPSTKSRKINAFLEEQGMPLSICQLVTDLLQAERGNSFRSDTALLSLEEAIFDLKQMATHSQRYLQNGTCLRTTCEKTSLFNQVGDELHGREEEMSALMGMAERVSLHVRTPSMTCSYGGMHPGFSQVNNFICEAAFLSGHSGSGKSSIIKRLISFCKKGDWIVLMCKFDRQVAPLSALMQSIDACFGSFIPNKGQDGQYSPLNPMDQETFGRISRFMLTSIDNESLSQLCKLLPNFSKISPLLMNYPQKRERSGTVDVTLASITKASKRVSSPDGVGSGSNRLNYLFHIIFKALCSAGRPMALVLDDLQWSDEFTVDIIGDFLQTAGCSSDQFTEQESPHGGLLLVGSFRDNEVDADGFLMNQIKCMEQSKPNIKVKRISVGELQEHEINKMLSHKFCLPIRYTRELARLVYHKTRGNPMYVNEFLISIIQRKMLTFSVKAQRWTWDEDSIDFHMISKGVVELLTTKLQQLPCDVIKALKVASCFGQLNDSIIPLLDLGQFVPNMHEALRLAMDEGIVEKAGPLFAFSHDMLQESTYNLIPTHERKPLHKMIGKSLAQDADILNNAELCTLAADQINMCKDTEGMLDPSDQGLFCRLNLAAGKHSVAASSYDQAQGYFEAGISLLHDNPWEKQYYLSLELHEMSVIVSFMDGNVETVSSRLCEILSHSKSFDDALNSRALRAKFLASQAQYAESIKELLGVLSNLGEEFPQDAGLAQVTSEIKATQLLLEDITKEKILSLPTIKAVKELNKMKFMGLLLGIGYFSSPMLAPLVCCRMIELTFKFGSCEDTISGLAFMAQALLHYSDDIQLASRIGRIAESLIIGNINEHSLRAKLTLMTGTVKSFVEPLQAVVDHLLKGYNSAKIVGDVDNAVLCGVSYCMAHFFALFDLIGLQKYMITFFQQIAKHKRIGALHSAMSYFAAVIDLVGNGNSCKINAKIDMKNNRELYRVAEQNQNTYLMHQVITNQMYVHGYFREHLLVAELGEKYRRMHTGKNNGTKRILDFSYVFFEGLSALCLARDTKQEKWRKIGEASVRKMSRFEENSTWNHENKLCLLKAELHYLNNRHSMAKFSYQAAIASACDHKFFHEEALANELYGIYLVENKMVLEGMKQLRMAMCKYKKWGAMKKADAVEDFTYLVNKSLNLWK